MDNVKKIIFSDYKKYLSEIGNRQGAIMNIGIDNLREINTVHGFATGDEILSLFTGMIMEEAGNDNVYRLESSDEFIVYLPDYQTALEGEGLFARIQKTIAEQCKEKSYFYTVSAGMVFFHQNVQNMEEVFSCAGYALNRAKEKGKNCLFLYDHEQFDSYTDRMRLNQSLQNSLENDFCGFEVYYQPIISMDEKRLEGAEALLRWKDEHYGQVTPTRFIPVLEKSGMMAKAGRFVIETAMDQQKKWSEKIPDFCMHINLSYVQFEAGNLVDQIRLLAEKTGVNTRCIVFEITESGFIGKDTMVTRQLEQLKQMGFQLALDDFGTGYSNFIYLKDMELDMVKLDREFICEAIASTAGLELLAHIVDTVHVLGMKICLEGIENPQDLTLFQPYEPELIQGYVFGKPVAEAEFEQNFEGFQNQQALSDLEQNKKTDRSMAYLMDEMQQYEKNRKKALKTGGKFMIPILFLTICLIALIGVVYGRIRANSLGVQLDTSMREQLNTAMEVIEKETDEATYMAMALSDMVEQSYTTSGQDLFVGILKDLVGDHPNVAGAGIWFREYGFRDLRVTCPYVYKNKDGEMILTYYYGGYEYNYFEQEYYTQARDTLKLVVTDPYYDKTMDNTIITFSYPFLDEQGEFLGCITVDLYVADVEKIVKGLRPEQGGYALLANSSGKYICGFGMSAEENERLNQTVFADDSGFISRMLASEKGKFSIETDEKYDVYFDTLSGTNWIVATCVEHRTLYAPVRRMMESLVIMLTVIVAIALLMVLILISVIRHQKAMELEQQKNLNLSQFRALRASYYVILSVRFDTGEIKPLYNHPDMERLGITMVNYEKFIREADLYVYPEDLEKFRHFSNVTGIREILRHREYISDEIRLVLTTREVKWVEITVSKSNGIQGQEFLYTIRDINTAKKREMAMIEENHNLITQLRDINQELFRMGITDKLTQVYNRDGLEYYAAEIFEEAEKKGRKLFLLLADMNRLKLVNDRCGHGIGDQYIRIVADALGQFRSDKMICARIGGDEFVLFGAVEDRDELPKEMMQKIRTILEQENAKLEGSWNIGISMGYFFDKPDGNRNFQYYCDIADQAMYKEKQKLRE